MSGQTWAKNFQPGAIRTKFRSGVRTKTPSEVSGCSLYNQGSPCYHFLSTSRDRGDQFIRSIGISLSAPRSRMKQPFQAQDVP